MDSPEVGSLVMTPAVTLGGRQLRAVVMTTLSPHGRGLPMVPWIPFLDKGALWGFPLPLTSKEVVGIPKLHRGGGPGNVRLLPEVPPSPPVLWKHLREELLGR